MARGYTAASIAPFDDLWVKPSIYAENNKVSNVKEDYYD